MSILWLKAFHLFFMVAWMAGIFYLPRLMVYHVQTQDQNVRDQFKIMERRLWFFVSPFAVLTLIFGLALIYQYGRAWFAQSMWLHIKLTLVIGVYIYHFYLYKQIKLLAEDTFPHSARFYRFLNEGPVIFLLAIFILAVVKPF